MRLSVLGVAVFAASSALGAGYITSVRLPDGTVKTFQDEGARQEIHGILSQKYLKPESVKAGDNIFVTTNSAGEVTISAVTGTESDFTTNNTVLVRTIEAVSPKSEVSAATATNIAEAVAAAATNGIPRITESTEYPGSAAEAEYAWDAYEAGFTYQAYSADYAQSLGVLPDDSGDLTPSERRSAAAIFSQIDAATETNAAQSAQMAMLAPIFSPSFSGAPTAPTPAVGDNSTNIATTAFVQSAIGSISVIPLASKRYDFSTNADVYRAVKDIVEALGGSVTNFPAIP